jgi:outer membrane protein assembly factor BamA
VPAPPGLEGSDRDELVDEVREDEPVLSEEERDSARASARAVADTASAQAQVLSGDLAAVETSDFKITGFPMVGYTPETGVAFFGYGVASYPTRGSATYSSMQLYAAYTLRNQILVGFGNDHYTFNERWLLKTRMNFKQWVEDYYGLGSRTESVETFQYEQDSLSASFEALRRIGQSGLRVGFNLKGKWLYQRDWNQLLEADSRTQGAERSFRLSVGARAEYDTRDNTFSPTVGVYVIGEARFFPNLDVPDDGPFGRFIADARGYFDVGNEHIIAVRGAGEFVTDYAPLSELVSAGGSQKRIKGIPENRGLNTSVVLAQVEYRSPYLWRFGFVGFAGIGKTFGRYGVSGCCRPQFGVGGGVRFALQKDRRINLSFDIGWSGYEPEYYLGVGETF